jgi:hypothetical protein
MRLGLGRLSDVSRCRLALSTIFPSNLTPKMRLGRLPEIGDLRYSKALRTRFLP